MGKKTWTDEEKQKLIDLYPDHTDAELCEILGKRITQLRSMKERLGLRGKRKMRADDMTGKLIGPLLVLGYADKTSGSSNTRWQCRCTLCGSEFSVVDYWLNHSDPYSHCKCTKYNYFRGEKNPSFRHGGSRTPMHNRYWAMRNRTENPNACNYKHYGGRGITVCNDWKTYAPYRDWCLANGFSSEYDTAMSVDRIDNDLGYSPENCRVIPLADQPKHRRNTKEYIPE